MNVHKDSCVFYICLFSLNKRLLRDALQELNAQCPPLRRHVWRGHINYGRCFFQCTFECARPLDATRENTFLPKDTLDLWHVPCVLHTNCIRFCPSIDVLSVIYNTTISTVDKQTNL